MILKLIKKIRDFYDEENTLISKEGHEILADPIKKVKLRNMVENYHQTGIWDFKIME